MPKRRKPQRGGPARAPHADQPQATNPALRAAILEVVDNQLRDDTPPEARQTLERLVQMGYTREGARELIATAVITEIFEVMKEGRPYDEARYLAALARLPTLPWD